MKPAVSVIIPTYNRAHYVGQAMVSVVAQTYRDFELIVIDDGSTDDTETVVRQFSDQRIVYLQQEKQNAASARNTGIDTAQGQYICFLDSDDLLLPDMLVEGVQFLETHKDVGLVLPGRHIVDANGDMQRTLCSWEMSNQLTLWDLLARGCPTGTSAMLIHRPWLDCVGGFNTQMIQAEDWDILLRLSLAGCQMAWLEKVLLCYRLHDNNLIRNLPQMRDCHIQVIDRLFRENDLADSVLPSKDEVHARLLHESALRAYQANAIKLARADLAHALRLDPTLMHGAGTSFAGSVRGHITYWAPAEPVMFIERICGNLPEEARIAREPLEALAKEYQMQASDPQYTYAVHPESLPLASLPHAPLLAEIYRTWATLCSHIGDQQCAKHWQLKIPGLPPELSPIPSSVSMLHTSSSSLDTANTLSRLAHIAHRAVPCIHKTPVVSVIVPTFNRARHIGQAISSVLAQSLTDFELIVVDDGSTDNTEQVVHQFADPRLIYLKQNNQKAAGARNTGIRAARGRYISFLDSDDLFLPIALAEEVHVLENHGEVGLVHAGAYVIDNNGHVLFERAPWTWPQQLTLVDLLTKGNPTGASGMMVRRHWLEKVRYFDPGAPPNEDTDLLIRLAHAGCHMAWMQTLLVCYRLHDGNLIQDPYQMGEGHRRLYHKFFQRTDIPPEIKKLKEKVILRLHLESAIRAYHARAIDLAQRDLLRAVRFYPDLLAKNDSNFIDRVIGHVLYFHLEEPYILLDSIKNNIPYEAITLRFKISALGIMFKNRSYTNRKNQIFS